MDNRKKRVTCESIEKSVAPPRAKRTRFGNSFEREEEQHSYREKEAMASDEQQRINDASHVVDDQSFDEEDQLVIDYNDDTNGNVVSDQVVHGDLTRPSVRPRHSFVSSISSTVVPRSSMNTGSGRFLASQRLSQRQSTHRPGIKRSDQSVIGQST
jgi:hypothetical protein